MYLRTVPNQLEYRLNLWGNLNHGRIGTTLCVMAGRSFRIPECGSLMVYGISLAWLSGRMAVKLLLSGISSLSLASPLHTIGLGTSSIEVHHRYTHLVATVTAETSFKNRCMYPQMPGNYPPCARILRLLTILSPSIRQPAGNHNEFSHRNYMVPGYTGFRLIACKSVGPGQKIP